MRSTILVLALTLSAAWAGAAEIRLEVKHRSSSTVYLSGGSANGLAVGDKLSVSSKGAPIAEIEVIYLAEHSASCKILRESRPVQAGDAAVIQKAEAAKPAAAEPETVVSAGDAVAEPSSLPRNEPGPGGSALPWARARGGVSFLWNKLWDETPSAFDFEQRNLRLDLGLWDIGGRPLQFNARARGRQDLRSRPPGFGGVPADERRDRLYELALRYDAPNGRYTVEAGRIGVSSLGMGYLDGAAADFRVHGPLRVGGFFGNRADIEGATALESGRKYGGYLRLQGGGVSWPGRYDAMLFGVREMAGAETSREYVGFQGRFGAKNFNFSQWLEVDLLRGWREGKDGETSQISNLSLAASYRLTPGASLGASYDQRRNYRTAETRSVPDILFDTFLHQGFRANADVSRAGGIGASAFFGLRLADDQSARDAHSYGGGLRHAALFGTRFGGSLDASGFSNGITSGYQASARLGRNTRSVMTDLAWGLSSYRLAAAGGERRVNQWLRLSSRAELSRGFWIYGEAEYAKGDDVEGPRAGLELGYRF